MVEQADGQLAGRQADLLLEVAVDDVVMAGGSGAARFPPSGGPAGLPLQLERHVLGDMSQPGSVTQPLDEPAGPVQKTAMVLESGQQADQGIVERRDGVRGPVLEGAEVDEQPDGGVVRPVVRAAQHLALENLEVGAQGRLFLDRLVLGVFVALDSRVHARIVHSDALRSSCRRRLRSMARSFRPSAAACRTILAIRPWASWAMRAFGLTSNGKTRRARRSKR